jgi:uncharacterized BrkB/YihY/UPF0761 family membrane protein
MTKLVLIKSGHTAIWVFFNVVIFYLLYAVVSNTVGTWAWVCIGLVLAEGLVLLLFKGFCPLDRDGPKLLRLDQRQF